MPNRYLRRHKNRQIIPQAKWEEYRRRLNQYSAEHPTCPANEYTRAKRQIAEDLGVRL